MVGVGSLTKSESMQTQYVSRGNELHYVANLDANIRPKLGDVQYQKCLPDQKQRRKVRNGRIRTNNEPMQFF